MPAYAALVSLINTIHQIQNHPQFSTSIDSKQFDSLREKLNFFLDFVERYNSDALITDLETQIAFAAHAAEHVIESFIVDQIPSDTSSRFSPDLQKISEEMDSIKEHVVKVGFKDLQPAYAVPAASSSTPLLTSGKTSMVGFDGYLMQLLEWLTGERSNREVVPIVGMGGIGKTILARSAYQNPLILQHFDVRFWVTISQQCNVRTVLETLSCIRESSGEKTESQLGEDLYKVLSGKRYVIILDDLWSLDVWNRIKLFFPNNCNRSRIIVTTRLSDVAIHLGSLRIVVDFLNGDDSWSLFCEKAFAQRDCPLELENIGKKIVGKCKGLPLSIVVIGGLLGKSPRTQQHWENVAQDIGSYLNSGEGNECMNILSLSYIHLPACLKPCFLYLGVFPEDNDIRVSLLTKLWVAEGFIKPNKDRSLEEVAEGYIGNLIDRNLILVSSLKSDGNVKSCSIHDLLRDLCLSIAEKEKFFYVMRDLDTPKDIGRERRIITDECIEEECPARVFNTSKSTRSIICLGNPVMSDSRLLRVFFVINSDSPVTSFPHVNLRFLASKYVTLDMLYLSVSQFRNLQTLIILSHTADIQKEFITKLVAPSEIWEMQQLRHLELDWISLPDPPLSDEQDEVILHNLQTLKTILNLKCNEEVSKRMCNIKKLHVRYEEDKAEDEPSMSCCLYNLGCFQKLELLNYFFSESPKRVDLLQNLTLPNSLKKLSLRGCGLHWNDLTIIGSLPHLEVLKFKYHSVRGPNWNPVEGEFRRLTFLGIYGCSDLIYWNADTFHFPLLKNLVLFGLSELDEIPSGIGEIPTLEYISLDECSVSAAISAVKILEEQESLGNEGLHVRVEFWDDEKQEAFREQVEQEGFASLNFQLF